MAENPTPNRNPAAATFGGTGRDRAQEGASRAGGGETPEVSISVPKNRPMSAVSDSIAGARQPSGVRACEGGCSPAASRNSQADPRNIATKNPFKPTISATGLTPERCTPAISAITVTNA
jgi:hypothetical protein